MKKLLLPLKKEWDGYPVFTSIEAHAWMLSTRHLWTMTMLLAGGSKVTSWWSESDKNGFCAFFENSEKYAYRLYLMPFTELKNASLKPANSTRAAEVIRGFSNLAAAINMLFSICASNSSQDSDAFIMSSKDMIRILGLSSAKASVRLQAVYEAICAVGSFIVHLEKVNFENGKEAKRLEPVKVWEIDFLFEREGNLNDRDWNASKIFYIAVKPGKWVELVGGKAFHRSKIPSSIIPTIARSGQFNDLLGLGFSDLVYRVAIGKRTKRIYGRDLIKVLMGMRIDSDLEIAAQDPEMRTRMANRLDRLLCEVSMIYRVEIVSKKFWISSGLYKADDGILKVKGSRTRRPKGFFDAYRETKFDFSVGDTGKDKGEPTVRTSETSKRWVEGLIEFMSTKTTTQAEIAKVMNRGQSFVSKVFKGKAILSEEDIGKLIKRYPQLKHLKS